MHSPHIVFIGAGNMAQAIIGGLIQQSIDPEHIEACAPSESTRDKVAQTYGIKTSAQNSEAVKRADIVVLAVKPQMFDTVCRDIAPHCKPNTLFISVAAGVTCQSIAQYLQTDALHAADIAIVRTMPNTPSQIGLGATGLYANQACSGTNKQAASNIMSAVGVTTWVDDESLINTVTAVSGSAPAYFFLIFEAMIDAAVKQGLNADDARTLTLQTALGAASLAQQSTLDIATLRRNVTSPNGTTERAVNALENAGIRAIFDDAMQACTHRAQELSLT